MIRPSRDISSQTSMEQRAAARDSREPEPGTQSGLSGSGRAKAEHAMGEAGLAATDDGALEEQPWFQVLAATNTGKQP